MCQYKSGIILKNRVVLTPDGNESHSNLLESLGIEDSHMNAMKTFVRAELIPPNGNKAANINEWKYRVDQDIVPGWYEEDPKRYEQEFRDAVKEHIKDNFVVFCGLAWTAIKKEKDCIYYLLDGILENSEFGKDNNYKSSYVREELNNGELAKQLKYEFGNKLIPITTNLLSLDGLDDYGKIEGDILAIPTIDLYRECRKNIPKIDKWWWLATPDSTPSGYGSDCVQCVYSDGSVDYDWYNRCGGVRPFFIIQS